MALLKSYVFPLKFYSQIISVCGFMYFRIKGSNSVRVPERNQEISSWSHSGSQNDMKKKGRKEDMAEASGLKFCFLELVVWPIKLA